MSSSLRWLRAATPMLAVVIALALSGTATAAPGEAWTSRATPVDTSWVSVAYGNGTLVAVANAGTGERVMTSPDGITWTPRAAPAGPWGSVAFGNGLFVAVSDSEDPTPNRVMTSPDGVTWTIRTATDDIPWQAVSFGGGQFVAVAIAGSGNRVMTSPDGITWTSRASAADVAWRGVTYANGLYVAVAGAQAGRTTRVMTSPDGITWTARSSGVNLNNWYTVAYGAGLFVALAGNSTSGSQVMTSPDGITWTPRTAASTTRWRSLVYAEGQFVAVGLYDAGISTTTVMTSPDGITWTAQTPASLNDWKGLTYANGIFVAVAMTGTGDRVMTSGIMAPGAPAAPTAAAGNRDATVAVAPGAGGAPSTYLVTAAPGGRTCTITAPATSCVVTGLQNRTAYTFTATATNASGTSAPSAASAAVTPRGPLVVRTRVTDTAIVSTFTAAAGGTVTQRAVRAGGRTRATGITVCSTTRTIAGAGRATIACAVTPAARALRRRGAIFVTLTTTLTLADGTPITSTRTLVLPRTKAPIRPAAPADPSPVTG